MKMSTISKLNHLLAAAAAFVVVACSAPRSEEPDLAEPPPDMSDPGYPEGPYGVTAGSTVRNYTFQGYFAPTDTTGLSKDKPLGEVSFDMLRKSGQKFAMIQLAAFW